MSTFVEKKVDNWLSYIQPLLRESTCLLCQMRCGSVLCSGCRDDLPWAATAACRLCAAALQGHGMLCGRCLLAPPCFDQSLAVFDYVDPVEWMIKRLKFHGDLVYGRLLGKLMVESLPHRENYCRPDAIIPVPLHATRIRERGFNQSLELAKTLGDKLDIPVETQGVVRNVATRQQSELTAKQRRRNVVGAFEAQRNFSGQYVVLVDDVMTTGTTLNELAKTLKTANAERVDVWVCARS